MKIVDVEPIQIIRRLREPARWPTGSLETVRLTLVKITIDDNIVGWGTAYDADTVNMLKRVLIDQDPFDREALWEKVGWRNTWQDKALIGTLSGINIALYDIIGKASTGPSTKSWEERNTTELKPT